MSIENIYYISQIASSVAVLASLVYLALQTRQTSLNQKAQMHESRSLWIRHEARLLGDPSIQAAMSMGRNGDPEMTTSQIEQFFFHATSFPISWEEQHRQHREGMIDDERWRQTEGYHRQFLTLPGWRAAVRMYITSENVDPIYAHF